tara:strand:- start:4003 stop:4668 length:666 start_codon:yes stop_codon:yes gene_type:complete
MKPLGVSRWVLQHYHDQRYLIMGEYAKLKSTGEEIKIGTCESCYYLRFDDRHLIEYDHSFKDMWFRLPFPDEDHISVGSYDDYDRAAPLYDYEDPEDDTIRTPFTYEGTEKHPGLIQLRHDTGLMINVPCYHGQKLPEMGEGKAFFNGKDPHIFELCMVKYQEVDEHNYELVPLVRCKACKSTFRTDWPHVLNHLPEWNKEQRLFKERMVNYASHQLLVAN